ncbi:hypothetical protein SBOR_2443 [Sclerotinia borealis F-4128]|uniref:Uncharacterized protein n=1 Tax=Sclerotinia borealis (strain F-4128) TaxID=1432307 RepID=W9CK59_SCLBF|nr:hypothetical protein SBOR_2443 [Sclerotinia borealis F-4128]
MWSDLGSSNPVNNLTVPRLSVAIPSLSTPQLVGEVEGLITIKKAAYCRRYNKGAIGVIAVDSEIIDEQHQATYTTQIDLRHDTTGSAFNILECRSRREVAVSAANEGGDENGDGDGDGDGKEDGESSGELVFNSSDEVVDMAMSEVIEWSDDFEEEGRKNIESKKGDEDEIKDGMVMEIETMVRIGNGMRMRIRMRITGLLTMCQLEKEKSGIGMGILKRREEVLEFDSEIENKAEDEDEDVDENVNVDEDEDTGEDIKSRDNRESSLTKFLITPYIQ